MKIEPQVADIICITIRMFKFERAVFVEKDGIRGKPSRVFSIVHIAKEVFAIGVRCFGKNAARDLVIVLVRADRPLERAGGNDACRDRGRQTEYCF